MATIRDQGFVKLRRGINEHVVSGKMCLTDFTIYTLLLINANHETGVWDNASAGLISSLYRLPERTCRDVLERLERNGYIKRFMVRGKRAGYPILINNYECRRNRSDGAVMDVRLNAAQSTSYESLVYDECRDGAAETVVTVPESTKRTKKEEIRINTLADKSAGESESLLNDSSLEAPKKPSREKSKSDPRHTPFKKVLDGYWHTHNSIDMPWSDREAGAMKNLLSANPTLDEQAFRMLLGNRHKSEAVNHSQSPRTVLAGLTDYAAGPLDRFGKPQEAGDAGRTFNRTSKGGQVIDDLRQSLKEDALAGRRPNARPDAVLERQRQNLANIDAAAQRLEGGYTFGFGQASHSQAGQPGQGDDGSLRFGLDGDGAGARSLGAGITLLPPAS